MKWTANEFVFGFMFCFMSVQLVAKEEIIFSHHDAKLFGAKDHDLVKRFPDAVIFDYSHKNENEYQLLLGEINFVDSDESDMSGYRASHSETITGETTRVVYDYPESTTTTAVLTQVLKSLKKKGFKQLYSCSKGACGDALGWKSYLYHQMGDVDLGQNYVVATKGLTTVIFYINEIAGQPRGVLDIVEANKNDNVVLDKTDGDSIAIVYFDLGKSNVNLNKHKEIHELIMVALKEKRTFILKGFTDSSGSKQENEILSSQRAEQVKLYLNKNFAIPLERIEAVGKGVVDSDTPDKMENAKHRKVEVTLKIKS